MKKFRKILALVISAGVALLAGYFAYKITQPENSLLLQEQSLSSHELFLTQFKDLNDKSQILSQWRGKPLIINFWAPWCAPCKKEIPEFIELYTKHSKQGLTIVGVALDEKERVAAFVRENKVNYPILIGDTNTVELTKKLGNRVGALPFTVFVNKTGGVTERKLGGVDAENLQHSLSKIL